MTLFIFLNRVIFAGDEGVEYVIRTYGRGEGRLKVMKEGLYTVFEAVVPSNTELLRLYIRGGGKTGDLGIMKPCGASACLKRKLSRIQAAALPEKIDEVFALKYNEKLPAAETEKTLKKIPVIKETPLWEKLPDGSMRSFDGKSHFLALPAKLRTKPTGLRLMEYEGREYLVFRY